jgi:oxygen-independent coproporphyrinogen-3 oxidase
LHIPFCKQACAYCNFHFTTSLRYKDELLAALVQEIGQEKAYLEGQTVETIYFGGGTPSLLSGAEVNLLLQTIRNEFPLAEGAEITLEANPDDITTEKLRTWKEAGINRLSIGVQTFYEDELRWMNRAHNADQSRRCIELCLQEGLTNLSIDLIYGSPLLSDEQWKQNVQTAVSYGIPHLSCYALTVEEKTPLHKQIAQLKKTPVDSDHQARQFILLMDWLKEAGYEHYEVSNFAKPGMRSRHNSSYWKGITYLGLGPSAHSFNGTGRRWNVAHNAKYIESVQKGTAEKVCEELTATQQLNECIMISLRTAEGLDLNRVEITWGESEKLRITKDIQKYLKKKQVVLSDNKVRLTNEGMLVADGIAANLFA